MTIFLQLRDQAQVVRRVVVGTDEEVTVSAIAGSPKFQTGVTVPTSPADPSSEPRERPPFVFRWAEGFRGPPSPALKIGDRVTLTSDGRTYELLENPKRLRSGRRVIGREVDAMELNELYPFTGQIKNQSDAVVVSNVPCAIWGGSDSHDEVGIFENRSGELPVEFSGQASQRNNFLVVGDQKLRITEAVPEISPPRVRLDLRRPGG